MHPLLASSLFESTDEHLNLQHYNVMAELLGRAADGASIYSQIPGKIYESCSFVFYYSKLKTKERIIHGTQAMIAVCQLFLIIATFTENNNCVDNETEPCRYYTLLGRFYVGALLLGWIAAEFKHTANLSRRSTSLASISSLTTNTSHTDHLDLQRYNAMAELLGKATDGASIYVQIPGKIYESFSFLFYYNSLKHNECVIHGVQSMIAILQLLLIIVTFTQNKNCIDSTTDICRYYSLLERFYIGALLLGFIAAELKQPGSPIHGSTSLDSLFGIALPQPDGPQSLDNQEAKSFTSDYEV